MVPLRFIPLLTALVISGPLIAQAEYPKTIQDFLEACEENNPLILSCIGMVAGVAAVLHLHEAVPTVAGRPNVLKACVPEGTTTGQLVQAFKKWAKTNPKLWTEKAQLGMVAAITQTWPCPELEVYTSPWLQYQPPNETMFGHRRSWKQYFKTPLNPGQRIINLRKKPN